MTRPHAVILAGGAARRMGGGDKGLREVGGRPLLAHALDRLRPQAAAVAINANGDPARLARWGAPVLPDPALEGVEDRPGPLAGLLAGLDWAAAEGADRLLTVAWDTPFFPRDLAARLAARMTGAGAAVAMACTPDPARRPHGLARHPTFALWRADLGPALREALRAGTRRVVKFAEPQGCVLVEFPAAPFDPFFNVNAPEDIEAAETIWQGMGGGA